VTGTIEALRVPGEAVAIFVAMLPPEWLLTSAGLVALGAAAVRCLGRAP
jgi:hypothetical protein